MNQDNLNKDIGYYDFNLYEPVHYEIIPKITQNWWLPECNQLTIGWCIHDRECYEDFMNISFPSKVKDLKIVYYKGMGECSKIWYDQEFKENAGRVTDKVRLFSLKLSKHDIAEIFRLFNHVKSIWFLNCELDIHDEIPIWDIYYQIEMLSIINWYHNIDLNSYLEQDQILVFLDQISTLRFKQNLKFINIRGQNLQFDKSYFKIMQEKFESAIILLESTNKKYLNALQERQYENRLVKNSNYEKDDEFYTSYK